MKISMVRLFKNCLNRNQTGDEPLVAEAASEFRNYCYNYRDSLVAGIIVAGWDKELGGQVYSIPLGGMLIRQSCTIGGSGSSYVYGFIKEFYRDGMPKAEAMEFVKKSKKCFKVATSQSLIFFSYFFIFSAVLHAMSNDGSSGGVVRIGVITKDGIERHVFFAPPEGKPAPTPVVRMVSA